MPLDGGEGPGDSDAQPLLDDEERAERAIVCARCAAPITTAREAVEVNGRHAHTFMNPSAIVFHIRCFGEAPGCLVEGPPTDAYAWFPGHVWRYAFCAACAEHLGWSYAPVDDVGEVAFFGLVEERLVDREG